MKLTYESVIERLGQGVIILEKMLPENLLGLYADGVIIINKDLTDIEKACVLLEEIGHHKKSTGNILDQTILENRRQEARAREWAAMTAITPEDIRRLQQDPSVQSNCQAAEQLCVTESMLRYAYEYYQRKEFI